MTKKLIMAFIALTVNAGFANTPDIVTKNTSNPKLYSENAENWIINGIKLSKIRSIDASEHGLLPNSEKDMSKTLAAIFKKAAATPEIDTVYVPTGTYYIADSIQPFPGTNLIGDGPGKTVFDRKDSSNYLLRTHKKDYKGIIIARVTLKNQKRIAMIKSSKNIHFFNNELHGGMMRLQGCSYINFEHNVFNDNLGKGGYASSRCDHVRIVKNRFNGIENGSINLSSHTNSYVSHNYITAPKLISSGYAGIRLPNSAKHNLVEFNYIENHGRGLFVLSNSDDNILRNNVVNKTKSEGALIQSPRTVLENNIFIDAGKEAILLNNQQNNYIRLKSENSRIFNNIIYDTKNCDGYLGLDVRSKNNSITGNKVSTKFGREIKKIAPNNEDINNTDLDKVPNIRSVLDAKISEKNKLINEDSDPLKGFDKKLIYQTDFSAGGEGDWQLEGPGNVKVKNNSLYLETLVWEEMRERWEENNRQKLDPHTEYYPHIQQVIKTKKPAALADILNDEKTVSGGHIVLWNKKVKTPDSYIISYSFKPLSPVGLAIVFFSAKGVNGEDVFSKKLKRRTGIFNQYIRSDINCYHISYWANNAAAGRRGTCNMRKNSGFFNIASAPDPIVSELDYSKKDFAFKEHQVLLIKDKDNIKFYLDGTKVFDFTDKGKNLILSNTGESLGKTEDTGKPLAGGRIGLRHMAGLAATYSDFKVYAIKNK